MGDRKNPRTPCTIVLTEETRESAVPEVSKVELDMGALVADQRVEVVALPPREPAGAQLVGVRTCGLVGAPASWVDASSVRILGLPAGSNDASHAV